MNRNPKGWLTRGLDEFPLPPEAIALLREYRALLRRDRIDWAGPWYRTVRFLLWQARTGAGYLELTETLLLDYAADCLRTYPAYSSRCHAIHGARSWVHFLHRRGLVLQPWQEVLQNPRRPFRLPRKLPTYEQILQVLALPDSVTPEGLRDRALLETLYGTGMRVSEARRLELPDVDLAEAEIVLRITKTRISRRVYLTRSAVRALKTYLREGRPRLIQVRSGNALWLNSRWGTALDVKRYLQQFHARWETAVRLDFRFHFGLMRHCFASHLLQAGAGLFEVQQLLGHQVIESTQAYTQLRPEDLAKCLRRCHPRGRFKFQREASIRD